MDIGFALGAAAVGALMGCGIHAEEEEEKLLHGMGCKCRKGMDPTYQDGLEGPRVGCGGTPVVDEQEEERRARALRSRYPLNGPFSRRLAGNGPVPPGYNCQATQEGGVICSDGTGFPPGCPKCPAPNYPGVADKRVVGNMIVDVPPPWPAGSAAAPAGAATESGGIPIVPLAVGGGILALLLLS